DRSDGAAYRLRRDGGVDRESGPGDQRRHRGRPSRRCPGQTDMAAEPVRRLLALAARSRGKPLVSDDACVPANHTGRLVRRDASRRGSPAEFSPVALTVFAIDGLWPERSANGTVRSPRMETAMRSNHLSVRPMSGAVGAEVAGVDLSGPLSEATI